MVSAPLPFRRWETPAGLAPSLIFEDGVGPGIYVLEFSNGDQYVGQSIHPATRFASHRRRWQDIVAVNFTPVPPEELDRVEQAMITEKRRADVRLRNRTLLAQPFGDSPLDFIVTQEEQAAWIGDDPMNVEREIAPQRIVEARARRRTDRGRLPEPVREHPHLAEAVDSIAGYLYYVIPLPTETEGRGWVLSAWPSTNRARSHRRFATLSIQKVEMLYLYEARTEDGEWEQTMVLNVHDSLEIDDELRPLFFQTAYRTTGPCGPPPFTGGRTSAFSSATPQCSSPHASWLSRSCGRDGRCSLEPTAGPSPTRRSRTSGTCWTSGPRPETTERLAPARDWMKFDSMQRTEE